MGPRETLPKGRGNCANKRRDRQTDAGSATGPKIKASHAEKANHSLVTAMTTLAVMLGVVCVSAANMNGRYSVASVNQQDVPFNDDYA